MKWPVVVGTGSQDADRGLLPGRNRCQQIVWEFAPDCRADLRHLWECRATLQIPIVAVRGPD